MATRGVKAVYRIYIYIMSKFQARTSAMVDQREEYVQKKRQLSACQNTSFWRARTQYRFGPERQLSAYQNPVEIRTRTPAFLMIGPTYIYMCSNPARKVSNWLFALNDRRPRQWLPGLRRQRAGLERRGLHCLCSSQQCHASSPHHLCSSQVPPPCLLTGTVFERLSRSRRC